MKARAPSSGQGTPRGDDGTVRLQVRVQPRASREGIEGPGPDGSLKIRVCSPPVDGAANERLVTLVAKRLRIPKAMVSVVSGGASRNKVLEVRGAGKDVGEIHRRMGLE